MNRHRVSLLMLCLCGFFANSDAQAQELEWIRQFGTTGDDVSFSVFSNDLGNVYVSGYSSGSLGGPNSGSGDAFVRKYDEKGSLKWSRQFGSAAYDYSSSVAGDILGNVYITGYTEGNLSAANAGSRDVFVSKLDASGGLLWTRQLGTAGDDESTGISADAFGNVYVSGFTRGDLGGPNVGYYDAFLGKFDSTGNLQWIRQLGTALFDESTGVSTDLLGNVYISGFTYGSLVAKYNNGNSDAFVSKYDSSGNLLWTRQTGTADYDACFGISVDKLGNVYTTGHTYGNFGGPNAGPYDAFVIKYDSSGSLQWTRQLGTEEGDLSRSVSADSLGNVYISGYTVGNLGGLNTGLGDAFVVKFDAAGSLLWTRQLGSSVFDDSTGISADSFGNVYIAGGTHGNLGGPNAGPFGSYDAFLVKFSTIPEPGTLLLATLSSVALLLPRARRQTERTLISTNPR